MKFFFPKEFVFIDVNEEKEKKKASRNTFIERLVVVMSSNNVENELYIDSGLYADRQPICSPKSNVQMKSFRSNRNPCRQIFRTIRSKTKRDEMK